MDEQRLPGGRTFGAVRTAGAVHRAALGPTITTRARVNAEMIRRTAADGDPTYTALLPVAETMERSARYVAALPDAFWKVQRDAKWSQPAAPS